MIDDERIKKSIEAALTHDIRINLPQSELEISCEAGNVTLAGTISSIAGKRLARRLAEQTPEVKQVNDLLDVAIAGAMGDKQITQHIRRAFIQERNLDEDQIDIQTDARGRVILRGHVHSQIQRRLAEVLSWWVPGVSNVKNLLVLNPDEEDNDEELKDNLLIILEKDPIVNPKQFQLTVEDRIVTLEGRVNSDIEREAAERDCWFTPGVLDVDNKLMVA